MNIAVYCGSSAGSKEAYTIGAVALGMWSMRQVSLRNEAKKV